MRESNYTYPPQNRAVLAISHLLYDRRGLDTRSPLAILNNLTSLTNLTQSSPRIREILTTDGGLERLVDILRESCLPREIYTPPDMWGLNGPCTARVINVDRQVSLRHSLAFQCVVNIGVRGTEAIRTRVVQAGTLDVVGQILESWLIQHDISIHPGPLGSQGAVEAARRGLPAPGTQEFQSRFPAAHRMRAVARAEPVSADQPTPLAAPAPPLFGAPGSGRPPRPPTAQSDVSEPRQSDTDVDMADVEPDEGTDTGSLGPGDDSMDVDGEIQSQAGEEQPHAGPSTTPRARQHLLPMAINIPTRTASRDRREAVSQASSAGNSLSGDDHPMPRATSDNNLVATATHATQAPRPAPLNLSAPRIPQLATDPISNQSSPMGTPTRNETVETIRTGGRRGTIVARPLNLNLAPRNERRFTDQGSGTSDGGEDMDLPAATIAAGIAAVNAQAMETGGTIVPDETGPPPNVEIVEGAADPMADDPDPEMMAAEQARLDMEAGAPPGQPGAAQTPRVTADNATPQQAALAAAEQGANTIIIANGAPRGFHDLATYVGLSSMMNPDGLHYPDDSILLSLQLLAYLSKYPHVRAAFHHPRRPMHPTFVFGTENANKTSLPERPSVSHTTNIFSLVERFTFRPSPSDPLLTRVPADVQYWAGVIMRNACRKDEAKGGTRQCASMSCGKWETFAREFAKCRRCRKAKYCSKQCQSKAWSDGHRFWCSTRSEEPPPGQGGPGGPGGPPPPGHDGDDDDEDQPRPPRPPTGGRDHNRREPSRSGASSATTATTAGSGVASRGVGTAIAPEDQDALLRETLRRVGGRAHDRVAERGLPMPGHFHWDSYGQRPAAPAQSNSTPSIRLHEATSTPAAASGFNQYLSHGNLPQVPQATSTNDTRHPASASTSPTPAYRSANDLSTVRRPLF